MQVIGTILVSIMDRYNNIKYTFKQAKSMLKSHKDKLQMALPEWDKGVTVRLYTKPNVTLAIYEAQRKINPNLPKDCYYLPDDLYKILIALSKCTEDNLELITEPVLYKHRVIGQGVPVNSVYNPTSGEQRRKDWILYKI